MNAPPPAVGVFDGFHRLGIKAAHGIDIEPERRRGCRIAASDDDLRAEHLDVRKQLDLGAGRNAAVAQRIEQLKREPHVAAAGNEVSRPVLIVRDLDMDNRVNSIPAIRPYGKIGELGRFVARQARDPDNPEQGEDHQHHAADDPGVPPQPADKIYANRPTPVDRSFAKPDDVPEPSAQSPGRNAKVSRQSGSWFANVHATKRLSSGIAR